MRSSIILGYWLFHCHIEFHAEVGMSLVFKVGDHSEMLPVPTKFPQCGDWQPIQQEAKPSTSIQESVTEKSTATNLLPDSKLNEDNENSVQQFISLLPKVLKALQISSSAPNAFVSTYVVFTCTFVGFFIH